MRKRGRQQNEEDSEAAVAAAAAAVDAVDAVASSVDLANVEDFKRRKIDEWKRRAGHTSEGAAQDGNSGSTRAKQQAQAAPGEASEGAAAVPGFSLDALKRKLEERKRAVIQGIAIDTAQQRTDGKTSAAAAAAAAAVAAAAAAAAAVASVGANVNANLRQSSVEKLAAVAEPYATAPGAAWPVRIANFDTGAVQQAPRQTKLVVTRVTLDKSNPYYDRSLGVPVKRLRKSRELSFVAPGKIAQKAARARAEARLEALKKRVAVTIHRTGVGAALATAAVADQAQPRGLLSAQQQQQQQPPPTFEWWDHPLLPRLSGYDELLEAVPVEYDFSVAAHAQFFPHAAAQPQKPEKDRGSNDSDNEYSDTEGQADQQAVDPITAFVLHPASAAGKTGEGGAEGSEGNDAGAAGEMREVMLTKRERMKLRRQRRLEEQRERQDKIKLGLLPPEQPKVRLSNLMRVLQNESVQDPTRVEADVRAQVRERRRVHEEANRERALTKDQQREKKQRKRDADEARGLHAAIYKCRDLTHPLVRAKIDASMEQLGMSGVGVVYRNHQLIVAEGGARAQRHLRSLMLRRIQWGSLPEPIAPVHEEGTKSPQQQQEQQQSSFKSVAASARAGAGHAKDDCGCWVVWEGEITGRAFCGFRFRSCMIERQVHELFTTAGVANYWTLTKSWMPPSF